MSEDKTVLAFGTFDHLHPGHRFILREAEKLGKLHVIIGRDSTVEKIKGRLPLQSEEERLEGVQEAFPEASVHLGDSEDYMHPVRDISPDIIVLGYDQRLPPGITEDDLGCEIVRIEAFEPEKWKSSLRS